MASHRVVSFAAHDTPGWELEPFSSKTHEWGTLLRTHNEQSQKIRVLPYLEIRREMSCMLCKFFDAEVGICTIPGGGQNLLEAGEKSSVTALHSRFRF